MLDTEFGMVTEVRLLQPEKAYPPILATEFDMVAEVRLLQSMKALSSMLVTSSLTTIF